jgi:hypothetical protein
MRTEDDVYTKVVSGMGEYHTGPAHPEILSSKILDRVANQSSRKHPFYLVTALLFGWTSVAWVRRSMTLAAVLLIALFAYQQYEIVRSIQDLNARLSENVTGIEVKPAASGGEYANLLLMGGRFTSKDSIRVSVNDIQKLMESYEELRETNRRIYLLLQNNPDLLSRIEKEFGQTLESIDKKPKI